MANVKSIPEGYHTITTSLAIKNCRTAIDFYKRAFGAEEKMCMTMPDGKIGHCELKIGDSMLMLQDECNMGPAKSPETVGGLTCTFYLYVPDVDAAFERSV